MSEKSWHETLRDLVVNKRYEEALAMLRAPFPSIDPASFQALKDENERLKKDRNIQKAQSALRGRILQEVRDRIGPLLMGLDDEGDRIYLGSTNDKDWLTEIEETIFEVDDEVWATLNQEEADPYQDLYDLRVNRIPALQSEIAAKDERIAELKSAVSRSFCVVFLDGRNEHGSHVLPSFPCSIELEEERDLEDQEEAILVAAEKMGFVVGEDHVWAEFTWVEPQIGEYGRVELSGYWEFCGINEPMSKLVNARAALRDTEETRNG